MILGDFAEAISKKMSKTKKIIIEKSIATPIKGEKKHEGELKLDEGSVSDMDFTTAPSSTDAFQRFNNLENLNLSIKDTNFSTMNNTTFKVPLEKDIIPELQFEEESAKLEETAIRI